MYYIIIHICVCVYIYIYVYTHIRPSVCPSRQTDRITYASHFSLSLSAYIHVHIYIYIYIYTRTPYDQSYNTHDAKQPMR